jgi:hypothetical protein
MTGKIPAFGYHGVLVVSAVFALGSGTGITSAAAGEESVSAECTVVAPLTSCQTSAVPAAGNGRIAFHVCAPADGSGADWKVETANNRIIVRSGRLNTGQCLDGVIERLDGSYIGSVSNTSAGASARVGSG